MRVLVVEDEIRMTTLIRQGLEEETYAVDVVNDHPVNARMRSAYDYPRSIYAPCRCFAYIARC